MPDQDSKTPIVETLFDIDNEKPIVNALMNGILQGKLKGKEVDAARGLLDRPREEREQQLRAAKLALDFRKAGLTVGEQFLATFGVNGHVAGALKAAPEPKP
jgi:hypothetical protein